jgi:hypothetical protein
MTAVRTVRAEQIFAASLSDAQAHWYDTGRWAQWVDGLEEVLAVEGGWPGVGATVRWRSGPAGRGSVTEHVIGHDPLHGQTVEVTDDAIRGRQSVAFTPTMTGVHVELTLAYEIVRRSVLTPVIDVLFIRRAMTSSLEQTLERFGAGLEPVQP